ncbi:GrpB family protein [Clostridiaceae bacterium M8S5]|nr:GrpB family protein [Clostridiaceae bacterium M8S5]
MRKIIVEPYNPNWKTEFEKARKFYEELLVEVNTKIEHVGSTSVEGLWAKPILDIAIIVKNEEDSLKVIKLFASVGYKHRGDLGIKGREAFKYEKDNPHINWMEHHLYVCIDGCVNLRNNLLVRNHLRKNKEAVKAYSDIKRKLAKEYPNDIESYIDGKTDLLISFLKAEGMNADELNSIKAINKKDK